MPIVLTHPLFIIEIVWLFHHLTHYVIGLVVLLDDEDTILEDFNSLCVHSGVLEAYSAGRNDVEVAAKPHASTKHERRRIKEHAVRLIVSHLRRVGFVAPPRVGVVPVANGAAVLVVE